VKVTLKQLEQATLVPSNKGEGTLKHDFEQVTDAFAEVVRRDVVALPSNNQILTIRHGRLGWQPPESP